MEEEGDEDGRGNVEKFRAFHKGLQGMLFIRSWNFN